MTESNKTVLYCSFCGLSQFEVAKLVSGPTVFICNECVYLATVVNIFDPDFRVKIIKLLEETVKPVPEEDPAPS